MGYLIGIDIGGTFTDCIVIDDAGTVTRGKALVASAKYTLSVDGGALALSTGDHVVPFSRVSL